MAKGVAKGTVRDLSNSVEISCSKFYVMAASSPIAPQDPALRQLQEELQGLLEQLPTLESGGLIQEALRTIVAMAGRPADRLDWKILNASLQDMQRAIEVFQPYRHVRKVTIFGSARTPEHRAEYAAAQGFARCIVARGFMVMTGAGGGIMQAGNEGAGSRHSFGLNIQLPFEQVSNPFIEGDPKLINFKYFFTRKLFFLRESDAVALFPGGFGTQDEAFECLTLVQTGKFGPAPLVLLDRPGGSYWKEWEAYQRDHLLALGLISPEDLSLYTITDRLDVACDVIANFYRVYHSSRYVGDRFVLRLRSELRDDDLERLNGEFSDLLVEGRIEKTEALPPERKSETATLPRLVMRFNQKNFGRLHQMIRRINQFNVAPGDVEHPEQK